MKMVSICDAVFLLVIFTFKILSSEAETKAFFVFGDSLVDNGNNNYLFTTARADSPPYGIDYPTSRPTGRFSNGLNIPDIISERMGWEATLPYLSPELTGQKLLVGANFASAGVGILNDTGIQFANIIRAYQQLTFFEEYQGKLKTLIGANETQKLVSESLVLFTLGGNDFVNNYFLIPFSPRSRQYSLKDYVPYIISEYKNLLQRLYTLGPRRVLVTGTGPLGCVPAELAMHSTYGECADELQLAASLFNPQLVQMIDGLNQEINSTVFIAANTNQMHMDFISDPLSYGFKTSTTACCGQGQYNGLGLCTPFSNLCANRSEYVFWDAFHPTERANRMVVDIILNGTEPYMSPMNLYSLMASYPGA